MRTSSSPAHFVSWYGSSGAGRATTTPTWMRRRTPAVFIASTLALTSNVRWLFLAAFVGLGLTFAGLTDICPMGELLQKMPWNRHTHCSVPVPNASGSRS